MVVCKRATAVGGGSGVVFVLIVAVVVVVVVVAVRGCLAAKRGERAGRTRARI